jgi:alkylation response protein AidB-like acyl-CoA dehydrogenase
MSTTQMHVRPSEDGAAGAAALDEVLGKAMPDLAPDQVRDDDLRALWTVLTDGGWHLLGAPEEHGGFGLGLRDLVEVARVVGRRGVPVPLSSTLVTAALDDRPPEDRPCPVAVPRRRRPGVERVVHGGFPGAEAPGRRWDGFAPTLQLLERGRDAAASALSSEHRRWLVVLWTAEAVGAAEHLLDQAVGYARVREQFGKPIGSFQALKHEVADALLALQEATTALVWAANADELPRGGIRLALDRCVLVSETAAQVHGGIGMTWELGHHFRTRHIIALRDLVEDLLALEGESS